MKRNHVRAGWRWMVAAIALLGIGLVTPAQADTILFNPLGGGAAGALSVGSFNWSAGTAVAVGGIPFTVGATFTALYETALAGVNSPTGTGIALPGLNSTYQITEVATLSEKVLSFSTAPDGTVTAVIGLSGGPTNVQIFQSPIGGSPTYNFVTGAGFTSGTLIYSATVTGDSTRYVDNTSTVGTTNLNKFTAGDYATTTTNQGQGTTEIFMKTTTQNTSFFVSPSIVTSIFSGGTTAPFTRQAPASMFWNGVVPNPGSNNGTSGPDFLFQVDAASQSFAVPEPTSVAMGLTALAILPMVTWGLRKRRSRA
jgi:hypothetical protein